jgi:integrase
MKIRIWKPGEKGNPSDRHYYYQFFQRKNRYRGILDARNAEQAKQAAQKIWDEEWNRKYDPEPLPPPVQVLFADFVEETYLPWSKIHKGSYDDDVRITSSLANFFKGRTLAEIKPAMIEKFKAHRIGAGRAPATINRELSVLSKVFTLAVRHEAAEANPCQGVERFALDNERVRYLTEDEEQRLFEAMGDNEQLIDIVTIALHTGMRRGEIFNLKWFDLDFDRAVIHVRKTKTKLNRVVPMNRRVREVFNKQKRSSEYVFTSVKTGGRLMDVKKSFNTARLQAGIPDFQLRDLRHSCATRLSDRGEELVTVAEILGHTDIRMTKRYSHGMHERKRQALEKLVSFTPRQNHVKNVRKAKRQGARPAVST